MRKTKIVCTIGPASDDEATLANLIDAGMNVARLNFSHGNHQEHGARIEKIRKLSKEKNKPIAILLDTKGPEIRTGMLKDDKDIFLKEGAEFILTTEELVGNKKKVSVSYKSLGEDISAGDNILIDDGLIGLEVEQIVGNEIITKVINGGKLGSRKGVNLPGVSVRLPAITEKDVNDIEFGIKQDVDFIAASFVRKPEDVLAIKEILEEHNKDIHIIPKIENEEGVQNIDKIIEVSDGLMVARGDLGVEIPPEKVPVAQKMMIKKCNQFGKPVITATQMLDSMINNPRPTRAEASDVANAIYDGTDATMLSGETAAGAYPVKSVETMSNIALEIEKALDYEEVLEEKALDLETITNSISFATCKTAYDLSATAIITSTHSGHTARMVSKYRPNAPIVAATPNKKTFNELILSWGVRPVMVEKSDNTDEMIEKSITAARETQYVNKGDIVVVTAGSASGIPSTTNLLKVDVVGEVVVRGLGIGNNSASGIVKLAKNAKEAEEKINDGDILVTKATNKDYMEVIDKVSAIIAEEAGTTSHAAIVGLNHDVPVLVGVSDALNKLKDGSTVTVDSIRGLIYQGKTRVL